MPSATHGTCPNKRPQIEAVRRLAMPSGSADSAAHRMVFVNPATRRVHVSACATGNGTADGGRCLGWAGMQAHEASQWAGV